MKNIPTTSLKGQFLVAMPSLADPHFHKTISTICEHGPHGAMGLVINRIYETLTLGEIFTELDIPCPADKVALPVHYGGPVHVNEIFILHGPPFGWKDCFTITDSLALSNTKDILTAIAGGEGPSSFLITLGCAGWSPGQLEAEIKENSWLTCPVDEEIIFRAQIESRWEQTVRKMGIDPAFLSDTAGHA